MCRESGQQRYGVGRRPVSYVYPRGTPITYVSVSNATRFFAVSAHSVGGALSVQTAEKRDTCEKRSWGHRAQGDVSSTASSNGRQRHAGGI